MPVSDGGRGKVCKGCGRHLPLSEYHNEKLNPDGKTGKCKECRRRYSRKHRQQNPERYSYSEETRLRRAAQAKEWREANPDKVKAYYESHRYEWRKYSHERRARLAQLPYDDYYIGDIYDRDGWVCQLCNRPVPLVAVAPHPLSPSIDHIVPLSDPGCPGDVESNVQLAHARCNRSKGGHRGP